MYAATHGASWPNNLFLLQRGQETLHPYMLGYSAQLAFYGSVSYSLHTNASRRISVCLKKITHTSIASHLHDLRTYTSYRPAGAYPIPTFNRVFPPSQSAMGGPPSQDNCNSSWRSHRATLDSSHRRAHQTSETRTIPIYLLLPHTATRRMCRWL
jgi:hypothetical protein